MAEKRLDFLEELSDYKVASDDPDVRGWQIVDRNNEVLGTVDHLLADLEKRRVRYLDVAPKEELLKDGAKIYGDSAQDTHEYRDRKGDVHMIVPIGMARIDKEKERVIADRLDKDTFMGSPLLKKDSPITQEHEEMSRKYFEDPQAFRDSSLDGGNEEDESGPVERSIGNTESRASTGTSEEAKHTKSVSSEDDRHQEKVTPENSGVPNVDSRGKNVDSSRNESRGDVTDASSRLSEDKEKHTGSKDTIQSSARPMRPERKHEGKVSPGAPESLEAGATSSGAQAGSTDTPRASGKGKMDNPPMDMEDNAPGDRKKGGEETRPRDEMQSKTEHRESDESAARRKKSGDTDSSDDTYDEDRFFNRKK